MTSTKATFTDTGKSNQRPSEIMVKLCSITDWSVGKEFRLDCVFDNQLTLPGDSLEPALY